MSTNSSLTADQIRRYSRHLILDKIGIDAQRRICDSSVLVVGAGGLGSSLLLSLAGAGVGRIGIVDHDTVDISNLHRQILYKESDQGKSKVDTAKDTLEKVNSTIKVRPFKEKLLITNAERIFENYDVIADCTDNIDSRYLINDVAVYLNKPVVSAAAIGVEGQLSVYNYKGGPCLRCLFPEKSPSETLRNCSDNGVLGVVPGIMGSLQALEVLKIVGRFGESLSSSLVYFDAMSSDFKKIHVRKRNCLLCKQMGGLNDLKIDKETILKTIVELNKNSTKCMSDQPSACEKGTCGFGQISCQDLNQTLRENKVPYVLVDVRDKNQFSISKLAEAINIPCEEISNNPSEAIQKITNEAHRKYGNEVRDFDVYVMCRRGISSVRASENLAALKMIKVLNVTGGLENWVATVDAKFPLC